MIDFNFAPEAVTPKIIAKRVAAGVRAAMGMTEAQVYVCALGGYVDGQNQQTVQVVPGAGRPEGVGHGAQDGGTALIRRVPIAMWYWLTLPMDLHGMSQEQLIRESDGLLDFAEKLRMVFANTTLGDNVLIESMRYEGTSEARVFDADRGIIYCIVTYSGVFGSPLPSELTLEEIDLARA